MEYSKILTKNVKKCENLILKTSTANCNQCYVEKLFFCKEMLQGKQNSLRKFVGANEALFYNEIWQVLKSRLFERSVMKIWRTWRTFQTLIISERYNGINLIILK